MRFLVELGSDRDGRITGQVAADGGPAIAFSGWLDLLRHLEQGVRTTGDRGAPTGGHD